MSTPREALDGLRRYAAGLSYADNLAAVSALSRPENLLVRPAQTRIRDVADSPAASASLVLLVAVQVEQHGTDFAAVLWAWLRYDLCMRALPDSVPLKCPKCRRELVGQVVPGRIAAGGRPVAQALVSGPPDRAVRATAKRVGLHAPGTVESGVLVSDTEPLPFRCPRCGPGTVPASVVAQTVAASAWRVRRTSG